MTTSVPQERSKNGATATTKARVAKPRSHGAPTKAKPVRKAELYPALELAAPAGPRDYPRGRRSNMPPANSKRSDGGATGRVRARRT